MKTGESSNHPRLLIGFCGISGFIGVLMGALGSHLVALPEDAARMATASQYQLLHSIGLLALGGLPRHFLRRLAQVAWAGGVVLFCGSLYAKALLHWPSTLAPFGGTLLMLGWLSLLVLAFTGIGKK